MSEESLENSHLHHIEEISRVVTALSTARFIEEAAKAIRRAASRLTGADGATFVLRDDDNCRYLNEEAYNPRWRNRIQPIAKCLEGWCIENGNSVLIRDIALDQRVSPKTYRASLVKSLLMVPVKHKTETIGVVTIFWTQEHEITPAEQRLLKTLADTVAVSMRNFDLFVAMEKIVEERTESLQAVNHELESYAYTVAHDLKNPLAVVKMNVWSLREFCKDELSEKGLQSVARIEKAAIQMQTQIEGLLSIHVLTKAELVQEDISLTLIAREVAEELREVQPEQVVSVEIEDDLHAYGDAALLRVVLENLLENAWKYSSKVAAAKVQVGRCTQNGIEKCFFVKDNGAGFPMEKAEDLFTVFRRLHAKEDFAGSGVGLASVQRIIHKHGGMIWAESEPGEGACFYFTLPFVPLDQKVGDIAVANLLS